MKLLSLPGRYRWCGACRQPVRDTRDGPIGHKPDCHGTRSRRRREPATPTPVAPIELVIPGRPGVWQRPAPAAGGGRRTEDRHAAALDVVGWHAKLSLPRCPYIPDGPVIVEHGFYFPADAPRRADGDNLTKLLFDGLNGIGYADDAQIVGYPPLRELHPSHFAVGEARTVVRLYRPEGPCA